MDEIERELLEDSRPTNGRRAFPIDAHVLPPDITLQNVLQVRAELDRRLEILAEWQDEEPEEEEEEKKGPFGRPLKKKRRRHGARPPALSVWDCIKTLGYDHTMFFRFVSQNQLAQNYIHGMEASIREGIRGNLATEAYLGDTESIKLLATMDRMPLLAHSDLTDEQLLEGQLAKAQVRQRTKAVVKIADQGARVTEAEAKATAELLKGIDMEEPNGGSQ